MSLLPLHVRLPHSESAKKKERGTKRVAFFSGAYNHISDGVALTLNQVVEHFECCGIPTRVFAPTVDKPALDHSGTLVPVPSVSFPGRSEYQCSLGITPSVRAALDDFNPTLIQISTPDFLGSHALRYARKHDIPTAGTYHTHFASYLKYYRLSWLEPVVWGYLRRFYQKCDHVYVPTTAMQETLQAHGINRGLRLWQRGVDLDHFEPACRSLAWRRAHGIGDDEVVVGFVSRLVWEKGLDVLASVIEFLERKDVPHRSLIVGDGPARNALESRLPNTVFTGFLSGDELATAYASSDLFLFPSDTETFGRVTIEAMASGLPVVGADAAGTRDLVHDDVTGWLCSPDNTDEFAKKARRLITNEALRNRMSKAAIERAQTFAWDAILAQLIQHHDDLLEQSAAPPDAEDTSTEASVQ